MNVDLGSVTIQDQMTAQLIIFALWLLGQERAAAVIGGEESAVEAEPAGVCIKDKPAELHQEQKETKEKKTEEEGGEHTEAHTADGGAEVNAQLQTDKPAASARCE